VSTLAAPRPRAASTEPHVHRWGHGPRTGRCPDALLTDAERSGRERPPSWPTPLLCLDCGVLWPGEPIAPAPPEPVARPRFLFGTKAKAS
jgi:hypothetical protein